MHLVGTLEHEAAAWATAGRSSLHDGQMFHDSPVMGDLGIGSAEQVAHAKL